MSISQLKFLVADDEPSIRELVRSILAAQGCTEIYECSSGADALKVLNSRNVDVILSDWEMPLPDGLELVKIVRSDSRYKDIPFIMITSPISNETIKIEDAGHAGVDAYLIKPFRARVLVQKISEVLEEKAEKKRNAVVIADDDEMVRGFVAEVAAGMGFDPVFQFATATDAYQFLEANHQRVALVISDWEMPGLTGIEFLHKIRINKNLMDMPFIMVTSQQSVEIMKVKKAIEADVDNYLMKPFTVETLQTKIKLVITEVKLRHTLNRALENGAAAMEDFDFVDAEKYYKHARTLDPRNVGALIGLAKVELKREHVKGFEEATKYFRTAIELDPGYDLPYLELALAYEAAMALDKATNTLREALGVCVAQDKLYFHLGRILIRRGNPNEGSIHLKKAMELNPTMAEAQNLLDSLPKDLHKKKEK